MAINNNEEVSFIGLGKMLLKIGKNHLKIGQAFIKSPLKTMKAIQEATTELMETKKERDIKEAAATKKAYENKIKKEKAARVRKLKANPAEALDDRLTAIEKTHQDLKSKLDNLSESSGDREKDIKEIKEGLSSLEGKLGLKDDPWHS